MHLSRPPCASTSCNFEPSACDNTAVTASACARRIVLAKGVRHFKARWDLLQNVRAALAGVAPTTAAVPNNTEAAFIHVPLPRMIGAAKVRENHSWQRRERL